MTGANTSKTINEIFRKWFVYVIFVVLVILFSLLTDRFMTVENILVVARQTVTIALLAFGMTFVITTGEIDLSVGSVVALTGMITTLTLYHGQGIFVASMAGILVGLTFGLANGLLTTQLGIPSFLVTLGTYGIARGIALTVTGTRTVVLFNQDFAVIWGTGNILGIPVSVLWVLLFLGICILLYNFTRFGNYIKATGGNKVAARYSGVKTNVVITGAFVISGLMAGVTGLLMVARINSGRPEMGAGFALDAITATILGGTLLSGGKGSIINAFTGAVIITMITNALVIMGIQSNIQMIIKGAIVILAVSINDRR